MTPTEAAHKIEKAYEDCRTEDTLILTTGVRIDTLQRLSPTSGHVVTTMLREEATRSTAHLDFDLQNRGQADRWLITYPFEEALMSSRRDQ